MAKITFIILAHENADHVADLASLLTEWDPHANAVIHYDLNAPPKQYERLKSRVRGSRRIFLIKDRLKCGWGGFSLVDAVVRGLRLIRREKIDCDRVMLVSGACMPIRPLAELSEFLDAHPTMEFIETQDSSWMVGGLRKERYQYWHFFNQQTQPRLFNWHFHIQRRFWPKRRFPRALEPRFGSQWWCLTWKACAKILDYIEKHPLTYFFFSTTWIPDELFFQTMAFKFTHGDDLARRSLTFFHFNNRGKPVVLLDDHREMIRDLPFFFARKISFSAKKLRAQLTELAGRAPRAGAPEIDLSTPYSFPYEAMLSTLPKSSALAPPLFQRGNVSLWSDVLDACPKSFAILYGPPKLVRLASNAIRPVPGLTVLGRVLHPDTVDFGPDTAAFHGLHADDELIRDFDRPTYFARILDRAESLPVIELCPGDDLAGEQALLQSPNAIVLPVVLGPDSDVARQAYWALAARTAGATGTDGAAVENFRAMQAAIEATVPREERLWTDAFLAAAAEVGDASADRWQMALRFSHGDPARPLAEALDAMEAAINAVDPAELTRDMPDGWRRAMAALSDLDLKWRILKLNFPATMVERIAEKAEASAHPSTGSPEPAGAAQGAGH